MLARCVDLSSSCSQSCFPCHRVVVFLDRSSNAPRWLKSFGPWKGVAFPPFIQPYRMPNNCGCVRAAVCRQRTIYRGFRLGAKSVNGGPPELWSCVPLVVTSSGHVLFCVVTMQYDQTPITCAAFLAEAPPQGIFVKFSLGRFRWSMTCICLVKVTRTGAAAVPWTSLPRFGGSGVSGSGESSKVEPHWKRKFEVDRVRTPSFLIDTECTAMPWRLWKAVKARREPCIMWGASRCTAGMVLAHPLWKARATL